MKIEDSIKLDFSDVLIKPKRSTLTSRKEAILSRPFTFKYSSRPWSGIPIVSANMDTTGTFDMASVLSYYNMVTALHKHYTIDEMYEYISNQKLLTVQNNLFVSVGIGQEDWGKYLLLREKLGYFPNVCIDVANGYMEKFVQFCTNARDTIGDSAIIMAGNVVSSEMTEQLILKGVDIVKVGIGSGAHCTTRVVAGVGYPQLSAIIECADAAHGLGGHICSDGGITNPGDMVKAFGAGADFVMIGSEFAGHDESGGDEVYNDGEIVGKVTYGMSSSTAMKKHYGKVDEYRSSEGRTSVVPYRGPLLNTIQYYCGGLRSGMTYVGAKSLKELSKRTTFIRVNRVLNEKYEKETLTKR
ncbi:MAG: GMP reductase [Gammaproteobacteria bacterium]|nr:GMP reductase [Gammaproteobacteria bacterium]